MSADNVEIVKDSIRAWNERDLDALFEVLDPEVELIPLRSRLEGGTYRGHEGLRLFIGDSADEWDRMRVEIDELRDLGDRVLILGRFQAKGRASGVEMDMPAAWITSLRDGRVVRMQAYSRREDALRDAGLDA